MELSLEAGRILGKLGETMPRVKTSSELFAVERRAEQMSLERKVLPDRSEVREKRLSALGVAKPAKAPLTFTRRLMAIFGPIVHAGSSLDEHVFDICQLRDAGLRGRITAQLVGDNLARRRARTKHAPEESFGCGRVAPLLQQDIEFGAVLVNGSPHHIRFTAQHHEQLVEMPGTARFAPGCLDAMREPCAEFIAPAAHGFVTHHDATLEQQLFNVAQAQLKSKVPTNDTTDHHRWEAMPVIERFRLFHLPILRDHLGNVTKPFELVSRRYGVASTVVTTNRPFGEWHEVFPNAACVVSLVDRLVHRAEVVVIEGESYRVKEARERAELRTKRRTANRTEKK
jgi:hypothetical protein